MYFISFILHYVSIWVHGVYLDISHQYFNFCTLLYTLNFVTSPGRHNNQVNTLHRCFLIIIKSEKFWRDKLSNKKLFKIPNLTQIGKKTREFWLNWFKNGNITTFLKFVRIVFTKAFSSKFYPPKLFTYNPFYKNQ